MGAAGKGDCYARRVLNLYTARTNDKAAPRTPSRGLPQLEHIQIPYRTLDQLALVTNIPKGFTLARRSSVGGLITIVKAAFQRSFALRPPLRSRVVSTQST